MLEKVLKHLKNWFEVNIYGGHFEISGGELEHQGLVTGQYFRICGSVLNDGVYRYPTNELVDETFTGTVWALAVPRQVVELAGEIEEWQIKNGNAGPYSSESFGGYSYSRATNARGTAVGWEDVFRSRLNEWRKL